MDHALVSKMAAAIQAWLEFQILCGREMLLSESYLSQPIGEFLRNHHTGSVMTERNHPNLMDSKPGRPRQIDYVLTTKNKGHLVTAIEAKWINEQKPSRQRLIDDVLRLEYLLSTENRNIERYFLVAGKKDLIEQNFMNLKIRNKVGGTVKFVEPFLPLKEPCEKHNIKVKDCEKPWQKYYKAFADSYNVELPKTFNIELAENSVGHNVQVIVWKVSRSKRRSSFSPESTWSKVKVPDREEDDI